MTDYRCTYCGSYSKIVREHVIPAHWYSGRSYDKSNTWLVPACEDCNRLAGAFVCFSVPEKARFILKRYRSSFHKLLKAPLWSPEELKSMSYKLRVFIEESQIAKQILLKRIDHIGIVCTYPEDYMRPAWIESKIVELIAEHERTLKSLKRKRRKLSRVTKTSLNEALTTT